MTRVAVAQRALPILLSPQYFTIGNREVHHLLRALNLAGHKIPHDILLPFLAVVKPISGHYPHDDAYAEALKAYACNPDGSAEQLLRAELDSPHEQIQQAAAEALGILAGVTDAAKVVSDALDTRGFAGLSLPHRHYLAVSSYDGEVRNGGHAQYFVNSTGQYWKVALAGLAAVGAGKRAAILQEAAAVFGAAGPALDGSLRHRQLAAFTPRQDQALDDLDSQYYECQENLDALLAQYATAHREYFCRTPQK